MKLRHISLMLALVVFLPLSVNAFTADNFQLQISNLIAQIEQVRQELSLLQTATSTPAATTACPALYRTLSLGAKGDDVIQLQRFLIAADDLSAEYATGYFGPLTEKAVQEWQQGFGVLWSGDPTINGYGVVGPKTRAAIVTTCSTGSGSWATNGPALTAGTVPSGGTNVTNGGGCGFDSGSVGEGSTATCVCKTCSQTAPSHFSCHMGQWITAAGVAISPKFSSDFGGANGGTCTIGR